MTKPTQIKHLEVKKGSNLKDKIEVTVFGSFIALIVILVVAFNYAGKEILWAMTNKEFADTDIEAKKMIYEGKAKDDANRMASSSANARAAYDEFVLKQNGLLMPTQ